MYYRRKIILYSVSCQVFTGSCRLFSLSRYDFREFCQDLRKLCRSLWGLQQLLPLKHRFLGKIPY